MVTDWQRINPTFVTKFKVRNFSIQEADQQSLWLASWGQGIIRFNTLTQKTDTIFSNLLLELPTTIYGPKDGQLWVGTQNNGLVLLDISTGATTQLTERDGLPHYHIKSIVADIHDQLWITTSGGGIARGAKQNFVSIHELMALQ